MPAPNAKTGPKSRRQESKKSPGGNETKNPNGNKRGPKASEPDTGRKDKKGKRLPGQGPRAFNIEALNPPFDPRMRKIGSPLNLTSKIRRGWIQSAEGDKKVNFLFNPSQLDLTHQIDSTNIPNPEIEKFNRNDVMTASYAAMGSSTGVKLLYDRTYELFSPPKKGEGGFANEYGVWADVAAWYVYLKMLPEMPDSWENSMILEPAQYQLSYLFVGPNMVYYGWVTGINVTYSHWTQNMTPVRCAVDIGFEILPAPAGKVFRGQAGFDPFQGALTGWGLDYRINPDGTVTSENATE